MHIAIALTIAPLYLSVYQLIGKTHNVGDNTV